MPDDLLVKALLRSLVLPPAGPLLLLVAGLLLLARRPRAGRILAWVGTVLLVVLALPVVATALMRLLPAAPLDPAAARTAQAVVILGGGTRRNAVEYGGDTMARLTLERVRYGARVARSTGLPVLVTGGTLGSTATEASIMRGALEGEYGVPVRWSEDRSRTTHENAVYSAALLRADGIRRVVLVTHAVDQARARAEFEAAGFEVVSAPTHLPPAGPGSWRDWVPSASSLLASHDALYELLALAVLWVATAAAEPAPRAPAR